MKDWLNHIDPADREHLMAYRATLEMEPEHATQFAHNLFRLRNSADFDEELRDAETDEDRAYAYLHSELAAYPFELEFPDSPFADI